MKATLFAVLVILINAPQNTSPRSEPFGIPAGQPIVVDGRISEGEWTDARRVVVTISETWSVPVLIKHDAGHLYVAFDRVSRDGVRLFPELLIDARPSEAATWRDGHWWLHASYNLCEGNGQHDVYRVNGVFACSRTKPGWHANTPPGGDVVEFQVSFERIGLSPTQAFGLAVDLTNATGDKSQTWSYWPATADIRRPSTWARALLR